jgi:hypothetical protein
MWRTSHLLLAYKRPTAARKNTTSTCELINVLST